MRAAVGMGVVLLVLAGCAGANTIAGREGLAFRIKNYYADNATEKGGICPTPIMRAITRTEVLEETDERLVLQVRYSFQDRSFDSIDVDAFGFVQAGSCSGFATRTFTISTGPTGGAAEVLDMSGERRNVRNNFSTGGRTPPMP